MEIAGETGQKCAIMCKKVQHFAFERLVLHFVFKDISPQIVSV